MKGKEIPSALLFFRRLLLARIVSRTRTARALDHVLNQGRARAALKKTRRAKSAGKGKKFTLPLSKLRRWVIYKMLTIEKSLAREANSL